MVLALERSRHPPPVMTALIGLGLEIRDRILSLIGYLQGYCFLSQFKQYSYIFTALLTI